MGTRRTFDEAVGLLASYNSSGSIEGVKNWVLPTEAQFKLLYATQGPDTVTKNGMGKRVFDYLSTYVWTSTPADGGALTHKAFAANSFLGAPGQFYTYTNATTLAAWAVAVVPEPETYAMLLAGLGLIGAIARRRKAKSA